MKKLFKMILVNALSLWIIDVLFISIHFTDTTTLIVTAAVLGFLNSTLKPFLKVISLPLYILSLGLFCLLINGLVFSLALNIGGGYVSNLTSAIIASIVYVSSIIQTQEKFIRQLTLLNLFYLS